MIDVKEQQAKYVQYMHRSTTDHESLCPTSTLTHTFIMFHTENCVSAEKNKPHHGE